MASITTPLVEGREDLFGVRPDCDIVCQIDPANNALGINQKFGGTRDIGAFGSSTAMQKVVTPDDACVRIRKQGISEAHFSTVELIGFHGIDADRCETKTARVKIRKPSLKTPQLGVTKRSPMAAIEDQNCALRRNQIHECGWLAILVR